MEEGSLRKSGKENEEEEEKEERQESTGSGAASSTLSSVACTICGDDGRGGGGGGRSSSSDLSLVSKKKTPLFALRCNSCRFWYHPWCIGYQLDLDRSCLITASDVDIPIDPTTGVPRICQWFCDSCASTVTGVVAATSNRKHSRSAVAGSSASKRKKTKSEKRDKRQRARAGKQ